MNDFNSNDPLWKLLGQAKPVEPRGNLAQNVLREARQTHQDHGLWARLRSWWQDFSFVNDRRPAIAGAALAAVVLGLAVWPSSPDSSATVAGTATPTAVEFSAAEIDIIADEMAVPLANLDRMDELLASTDTSTLSDTDIATLLY
jgi:hypothetical protein